MTFVLWNSNPQSTSRSLWRQRPTLFYPFTPKSDQNPISPAASPEILHHSMKKMALHSFLRWKLIILPIPTTSPIHLSLKGWENVCFWTWEWNSWLYVTNRHIVQKASYRTCLPTPFFSFLITNSCPSSWCFCLRPLDRCTVLQRSDKQRQLWYLERQVRHWWATDVSAGRLESRGSRQSSAKERHRSRNRGHRRVAEWKAVLPCCRVADWSIKKSGLFRALWRW